MKKLIFGITSLTIGGAERVLVDLVNELSSKYEITILTLYGKGVLEKELNNNIKLVNINEKSYKEFTKMERIKMSLKILFNKRKIYNKYVNKKFDVEVAFLEGPITRLFSIKNKKVKKIAWVHNDIGQVFGKGFKSKVKLKTDKKCYLNYDNIVFVSNDNKEKFEKIYKMNNNNKIVIQNFVLSERIIKKSNEQYDKIFIENSKINFLTVARLTQQKAIDRLIEVHKHLINDGYVHNFYIIGDGPEKDFLDKLIKIHNVEETFKLLGKKENPYPYIKNCDIFALLSYYEGYGIVIEEAKILNKPIIITNTAAREALENYDLAYIVENNEDAIYNGIKDIIMSFKEIKKNNNLCNKENIEIIEQIEKLVE